MTRLWILSDLHLETLPYPDNFRPDPPPFDVLVAAGDIQEGDPATPTGESIEVAHDDHGGSHLITIGDAMALHRHARTALADRIEEDDGAVPLVVITHHAPHPECLHPAQRGTWNAGNSASDLSDLTDTGRVALWAHGHVHHSVNLIRPGGTRLLCNPAGPRFANPAFDDALVIAVT